MCLFSCRIYQYVQYMIVNHITDGHSCGVSTLVLCKNFSAFLNLLKPTGHVIHQQFNIQQLYVLPTLYLCVLYLSENKQRLLPLTA